MSLYRENIKAQQGHVIGHSLDLGSGPIRVLPKLCPSAAPSSAHMWRPGLLGALQRIRGGG